MYNIIYTKRAKKDSKKIEQAGLKNKAAELLLIIRNNPFQNPPPYEKLNAYNNRRINVQHLLVYEVLDGNTIKIISMWEHYENIN